MAKTTTKLNAQDRVIPFCAATGIDHVAVGILARERGVCAHGQRTRGAHIPKPVISEGPVVRPMTYFRRLAMKEGNGISGLRAELHLRLEDVCWKWPVIWRNSIYARMIAVWRKLKIGRNPFKSIELEVDNEARRVGG